MSQLRPEVAAFRARIIDAVAVPAARFWYIDRDTIVGVCPNCDGPVGVTFRGTAAAADLRCHRGCTEAEVVAAMFPGATIATDAATEEAELAVDPRLQVLRDRREARIQAARNRDATPA